MSENKTILTTRRFELWWRKVQAWFAKQFTNSVDDIKSVTAKESTSQEIKELVLREGIILANEYAETINDIVGDFSNE